MAFILIDEAEEKLEEFFFHLSITLSSENGHTEEEIQESFDYIESLIIEDTVAPFLFLEVAKRILADKTIDCQNILTITSNINKMIETARIIKERYTKDEEYKNSLISSIFFLIPFTIDYFQETNDVKCFIHLFLSLLELVDPFSDEYSNLFNENIGTLLSSNNPYHDIIALLYSSKCSLKDEIAEMLIMKIQTILEELPKSDLNFDLIYFKYQLIFNDLRLFLTNNLKNGTLNSDFFLQVITVFFDKLIQNFESEQGQIFDHDIQLTDQIIKYSTFLIQCLRQNNSNNPAVFEFVSKLVGLCYVRFLQINKMSNFYLSNSISEFLLRHFDILNIQLIEAKPNYFINLITFLSIPPLNSDEFFEPEEFFFIDFYNVSLSDSNFLSNRQNVAQFIYQLTKRLSNFKIVILISRYLNLIDIEKVREIHFYILSILNLIVSDFLFDNQSILLMLYTLFLKYFDMSMTIFKNEFFSGTQKVMFNFTYLFFINSSFYILKMNKDKEEIPSIMSYFNQEVVNLIEIIKNVPSEQPYDDFYFIYFTFFCILTNNLIDNESLEIKPEEIFIFTDTYSSLCITNAAITLELKFCNDENIEFVINLFNHYMNDYIDVIDRYNKCVKSGKSKSQSNDDDDEEINDDSNKPDRILCLCKGNVKKMSSIIKNVDISNFDYDRLIEFLQILISTDDIEWKLINECDEFMSAIFYQLPEIDEMTKQYIELIVKWQRFHLPEWSIPISRVISKRPDVVDQNYYDMITVILKEYIESNVEVFENEEEEDGNHKLLATKDALLIFSLITRLFECSLLNQFEIQLDDFAYFVEFAFSTQPSEEYCDISDEYNAIDHELGLLIVKLASFLVDQTVDPNEIGNFFGLLVNDDKIVCQEMRYIIIFLIDKVLKIEDDENIKKLRFLCLTDEISKNEEYEKSYMDNLYYFIGNEEHPIFKIYQIEDFVYDDY